MKRNVWIAAIFILLAGAAIYQYTSYGDSAAAQTGASKPKAGYAAPVLELPDLDGRQVQIGGQSGKLTIVNFWASWCGPCLLEAPDLQKLHEEHGGVLNVYGVNATSFDREREARAFVGEQELTFPILMDRKGTAVTQYKIRQFPTSLLIDRNGKVVERVDGVIDRKEWERLIATWSKD